MPTLHYRPLPDGIEISLTPDGAPDLALRNMESGATDAVAVDAHYLLRTPTRLTQVSYGYTDEHTVLALAAGELEVMPPEGGSKLLRPGDSLFLPSPRADAYGDPRMLRARARRAEAEVEKLLLRVHRLERAVLVQAEQLAHPPVTVPGPCTEED